jgi:hypothetical protein
MSMNAKANRHYVCASDQRGRWAHVKDCTNISEGDYCQGLLGDLRGFHNRHLNYFHRKFRQVRSLITRADIH